MLLHPDQEPFISLLRDAHSCFPILLLGGFSLTLCTCGYKTGDGRIVHSTNRKGDPLYELIDSRVGRAKRLGCTMTGVSVRGVKKGS